MKNELNEVKDKAEDEKREIEAKYNKLDNEKNALSEKYLKLSEKYGKFERLNDCYNRLSDDVKSSCKAYLGNSDSITCILFNIVDRDNIESFWQYICDCINRKKLTDSQINILKEIFDIAFEFFQSGIGDDFVRLEVNVGGGDDLATIQKTSDSKQIGTVKQVLFSGYKMISRNKVIKRSLVLFG